MDIIKTRTAKIFVDEDSLVHITLLKDITLDYDDAMDNFLVIRNLTNNQYAAKLIDLRINSNIKFKANKFLYNKELKNKTKACAFLIRSRVKMWVYNFLVQFQATETCTRFFTNQEEAIEWLRIFN